MRNHSWNVPGIGLVVVGLMGALCSVQVALMPSAHAADNYEYARGLMKMQTRSFKTLDLVEHLVKRLSKSSNADTKLEAKLIEATLCRKQSRYSSVERRNELLKKADTLYKEFLEKGKNHRLYKEAVKEQATIQIDTARTLVKAAKENPAGGAADRLKAVAIFEKIANIKLEESAKAKPAFKEALKNIGDWFDRNPDKNRPPSGLLSVAQKALNNYIPRDKMYIIARMEQVGAYADGPDKKAKAHELIEYCKKQVESDAISQLKDVGMWYWFIKGRLHSMILEEEKATEAWRLALDIQIDNFSKAVKKTVFEIKSLICRDLVKMKMRSAKTKQGSYKEIIEIVRSIIYEPDMKPLFEKPIGKDLMIDYAHALTSQPGARATDYVRAIKELTKIVDKGPPWSNNASRAMATILIRARANNVKPRLSATSWYSTGRGFFLDGQVEYVKFKEHENGDPARAQTHYNTAFKNYENAVTYYRLAIGEARNTKSTQLAVRLKIEPQAWFEMGLAYLKMKRYRESAIAYMALEGSFTKEFRTKWMPDPKTKASFYKNKVVKEALNDLDKVNKLDSRKDGILNRTKKNIKIAASLVGKEGTRWAKSRKLEILSRGGEGGIDAESNDRDYQAAKLEMEVAKDLAAQGNEFLRKKKKAEGEKQYLQALAKFEIAGKKFGKVKKTSAIYEVALYQAASCFTYAQSLTSDKRKISKGFTNEARLAKSVELGKLGIQFYDAYEAQVASDKAGNDEFAGRRMKLGRGAKLNRTTVYYSMKDWKGVLAACQDYFALEQKTGLPPDEAKFQKIYFNMYRAYSYLAGDMAPPECDTYLAKAAELLPKIKSNKKFYVYAIQNLSLRYNNAAAQAEKAKMDRATLLKYESQVAKYQALAMKLKESPTLEDYGRLLYLYERSGRKKDAADIASKLLTQFDPENKNKSVDDKVWKPLLEKMNKIIKYSDLNKWSRCKKDHMILLDFIYDTPAGLRFAHDASRRLPAEDKQPVDLEKALNKIKTIRKNYPNCPTVKPASGVATHKYQDKGYLDFISSEVDFRRQIVATRDLLSTVAFDVALDLDKQEGMKFEADRYRKMADDQIGILLKEYGDVPEMKIKSANIKFANGDYDGAIKMLNDVKRPERPTTKLYIQASIRIAEVKFVKKDYPGAARYPLFQANSVGLESNWVKKWWPDMEAFLEKCYAQGIPRPKDIVVDKSDASLFEAKSEDEKKLEGLERIKKRAAADPSMKKRLITPIFVFEYKFFHGKVAHFNESKKLEAALQKHRGEETEKEFLTDVFKARYQLINELVAVETKFWAAREKYNSLILEYKSAEKVPSQHLKKKNTLKKKFESLRDDLKKMKKPKFLKSK